MGWSFNDNAPIYMQIVNGLQREIASGAYAPGTRLPSVRDLALEVGVNPNTMQRALAELERRGLVNAQRTAGRFVTEDVEALGELRKSMSEAIAAEFCGKLRSLGLRDEEIVSAVQAWIRENPASGLPVYALPGAVKTAGRQPTAEDASADAQQGTNNTAADGQPTTQP